MIVCRADIQHFDAFQHRPCLKFLFLKIFQFTRLQKTNENDAVHTLASRWQQQPAKFFKSKPQKKMVACMLAFSHTMVAHVQRRSEPWRTALLHVEGEDEGPASDLGRLAWTADLKPFFMQTGIHVSHFSDTTLT